MISRRSQAISDSMFNCISLFESVALANNVNTEKMSPILAM